MDTVLVGGRVVVERGRVTTVDEDRIYARAQAAADRQRAQSGAGLGARRAARAIRGRGVPGCSRHPARLQPVRGAHPDAGVIAPDNLGDLFDGSADPEKIALIDLAEPSAPREWTHGEIDRAARAVARGLVARGHRRGDRIAILSANRAEYLAAYLGIMRAGMVAVPVSFKLPRDTVHYVLEDAGARLVFADAERRAICPPGLPVVELDGAGFAEFLDPGPVRHGAARRGRGRDVPLHLGLDRPAQGRAPLARGPALVRHAPRCARHPTSPATGSWWRRPSIT